MSIGDHDSCSLPDARQARGSASHDAIVLLPPLGGTSHFGAILQAASLTGLASNKRAFTRWFTSPHDARVLPGAAATVAG